MFNFTLELLELGNFILASTLVIITFALLIYLFPQSWRNPVQRAFSALLAFVGIVYIGQVFLLRTASPADAEVWLRFKWIGIAFVPAAYLHFSHAVLRSTFYTTRLRRTATLLAYLIGTIFLALVISTDLVVGEPFDYPFATQLNAGPLFPLFAVYFFATTAWGVYNIELARRRSLTPTSKRRLRRLAFAFLAPALGVFPYLVFTGVPALIPPILLLSLTFVATLGLILMLVVMAYTVAYQGALAPDRLVKQKLVHFLLRGPLVAVGVVVALTIVPPIERLLHLSHETLLYATVVFGVIVFEMLISRNKGKIDRLLFRQDRREVEQIQRLDARLFTTTDLQQLLENILTAFCDLLRVPGGFALAADAKDWRIEAVVGARDAVQQFIAAPAFSAAMEQAINDGHQLILADKYWLYPLRANGGDALLGVLGISARTPTPDLTEHETELVEALASQAELALEDRQLQLSVFEALDQIGSEMELLQQARSKPRVAGATAQERVEEELVVSADFNRAVKDALDHYWGGPKLTHSPLLQLSIVQKSLDEYDHNPTRALRAVLAEAIERLRPEGTRSMTAPEWVLYNILELKVIQGHKVRDIALRLAMSESDLYRKQRIAIQEVAKNVQQMESRDV